MAAARLICSATMPAPPSSFNFSCTCSGKINSAVPEDPVAWSNVSGGSYCTLSLTSLILGQAKDLVGFLLAIFKLFLHFLPSNSQCLCSPHYQILSFQFTYPITALVTGQACLDNHCSPFSSPLLPLGGRGWGAGVVMSPWHTVCTLPRILHRHWCFPCTQHAWYDGGVHEGNIAYV